jgi:hypothetical protein
MAIDWNNEAETTHGGTRIAVSGQGEYDALLAAAQRLYADVGASWGSGEQNDFDSRVRQGQGAESIIANTYDDVQRRFKTVDTPQSRAEDPTAYDAQANAGRSFDPPAVMLEELAAPAREQAALMATRSTTPLQLPSPYMRTNAGPGDLAFGSSGGGLGGLSFGTILLFGGVAVLGFLAFRYFGKK